MIEPGKWQTREYRLSENAVADNFVCLIGDTKKVHMVFLAAYMVVLLVAVGLGLVDVVVARISRLFNGKICKREFQNESRLRVVERQIKHTILLL